jgi:hypothetical protein
MRVTAFLALAFAVTAVAAGADTPGELDARGGFEGARLGEFLDSFEGLERVGRNQAARTETYIRRSDALKVGGVEVDAITYSFYQGRLYFISVQMTGGEKSRAVLRALERTYGDGISTGTRPNEQIWPGGEVFVLYDVDAETGRGLAALTSTPIHAQMRLDRTDELGDL